MNNIHKHLEFRSTLEENNNTSYLDSSIHRDTHSLQMGIYRKPTQTDTTIHFTYNSPIRTQTCSIQLLYKQNAIHTNNRSGKTTGMEHYLHYSKE
jgi:hypothetical protein